MADPSKWRAARPVAAEARRRLWELHRHDPNVVGIGFGAPTRGGRRLDTPSCVVFVVRKLPADQLRAGQAIPRTVEVGGSSIETDVVETGRIYAFENTARRRPALPGISIGHGDVTAGTLGCIVVDKAKSDQVSILSNNHVLANSNAAAAGDKIYQPGPADSKKSDNNVIGTLTRWVPLKFDGSPNRVDCAVADVSADCDVYDGVMEGGDMAGPSEDEPALGLLFAGSATMTVHCPINEVAARLGVEMTDGPEARSAVSAEDAEPPGAPVQKTGRTTEYTTGRIQAIDVSAEVGYGGGKTAYFEGLIATTTMACGGDSGSLLCRGGSGDEVPLDCVKLCPMMGSAERLLGIPFTQEWVSIAYGRDKYLSTTLVGQWLIDAVFDNYRQQSYALRAQDLVLAPEDRAFGQALFAQYGGEAKLALYDPDRTDLRIGKQHLIEAEEALARAKKYLLEDESAAASALMTRAWATIGMNGRDLIKQLDDLVLYVELREIAAKVKAITDPHD